MIYINKGKAIVLESGLWNYAREQTIKDSRKGTDDEQCFLFFSMENWLGHILCLYLQMIQVHPATQLAGFWFKNFHCVTHLSRTTSRSQHPPLKCDGFQLYIHFDTHLWMDQSSGTITMHFPTMPPSYNSMQRWVWPIWRWYWIPLWGKKSLIL